MKILRRFHDEEAGQMSFLAVAGVLCFVGLMSMVINTDDIVTERIRMQDIADTTAISSAAWTARGLNMISFINVLDAKLISTAVLLNALADTLPVVEKVAQIQLAIFNACSGVPFVGAFCAAMAVVVNIQLNVLRPLTKAVRKLADSLSRCGSKNGALWSFMKALEAASTAIKHTFTLIGIAESIAIAKANGADFGLVVNGKMVDLKSAKGSTSSSGDNPLSLPVKKEKFDAFCPFVKNGGSGFKMAGYTCGEGPFKLGKKRIMATILVPFTNLFAHPIFIGMSAQHFNQVGCKADPDPKNSTFDVTLKDLNECSKYNATAKWSHLYSRTPPLLEDNLGVTDFAPWKPKSKQKGSKDEDDALDQGEIEGQLGNINIDEDDEDLTDLSDFKPGQNYDQLRGESVGRGEIPRSCNGSQVYPMYAPPPDGFNSSQPGNTFCEFQFGTDCKRITEWSQFKAYSPSGVPVSRPSKVGGYFIRVGKRRIDPPEDSEDPPTFVYIVETVSLIDAGTKSMDQKEFEEYLKDNNQGQDVDTSAGSGSTGCKKPEPYVLDMGTSEQARKDFQDKLRFIGVVYRKIEDDPPFRSNYFRDPHKTIIEYAQAQVYN